MAEAGILDNDERIELLDGRIVTMSPIGSPHFAAVNRLNRLFGRVHGVPALVSVQNPVRLNNDSEPEPDVALLRPRDDFYAERLPSADDVLLMVVEVADTSLDSDRADKLPLYAHCGVPEVWIAAVEGEAREEGFLETYRGPSPNGEYEDCRRHRRGDTLTPGAFPGTTVSVDDVLGAP